MSEKSIGQGTNTGANRAIGFSAPNKLTALALSLAFMGGASETAQASAGKNLPLRTVEHRMEKRLKREKVVGFALGTIFGSSRVIQHPLVVDRRKLSRVIDMDTRPKRGSTAYCSIDRETDDVDCVADRKVTRFEPQFEPPERAIKFPRPLDRYSTFFDLEPVRTGGESEVPPPKLNLDEPLNPADPGMVQTDANGEHLDVGIDITQTLEPAK